MKVSSVAKSLCAATVVVGVMGVSAPVPTPTSLATVSADVALKANVITVDGTYVPFFPIGPMTAKLGGVLTEGNSVTALDYPASMQISSKFKGIKALTVTASDLTEYTVIVGFSQGSEVVEGWLQATASDPGKRPPADMVTLVIMGWPKANGTKATIDNNPYDTIVVSRMFDGFPDMPDKFSMLALRNAIAGMFEVHTNYNDVDLDDPRNMVMVTGNTTHVLLYTEQLAINQFWRDIGLDEIADKRDARYRPIIDRAYNREGFVLAEPGQIRALLTGVTQSPPADQMRQAVNSTQITEPSANRSVTLTVDTEQESADQQPTAPAPIQAPESRPSKTSEPEPTSETVESGSTDEVGEAEVEEQDADQGIASTSSESEKSEPAADKATDKRTTRRPGLLSKIGKKLAERSHARHERHASDSAGSDD